MKIKRENDIDEVTFSFRIKITAKHYEIIHNSLRKITSFEVSTNGSFKTVIVDVENKDIEELNAIINFVTEFNLQNIDIYCGIISSYDLGGFTFPKHLTYFAGKLNCEIQFSYVIA